MKIMKRGLLLVILSVVLLSSFATAQEAGSDLGEGVATLVDEFVNFIEPVSSRLLGETPQGEYLFAKVLFLIIILAIVWTALNQVDFFSSHTTVLWFVSIAASILATRWLTTEALLNTILLPYSALGIAISAALPFVVYFIIVDVGLAGPRYRTVRRIAWVFFAIIFIGLYITRYDTLGDSAWIYPITVLASFIMIIWDGTIQRFRERMRMEKRQTVVQRREVRELEKELQDLTNEYKEKGSDYRSRYGRAKGGAGFEHDRANIIKKIQTLGG